MNGAEEPEMHFIQTYEKYLQLRDDLQEDPDEGPSLPGLYSFSSGTPGRSNNVIVG